MQCVLQELGPFEFFRPRNNVPAVPSPLSSSLHTSRKRTRASLWKLPFTEAGLPYFFLQKSNYFRYKYRVFTEKQLFYGINTSIIEIAHILFFTLNISLKYGIHTLNNRNGISTVKLQYIDWNVSKILFNVSFLTEK